MAVLLISMGIFLDTLYTRIDRTSGHTLPVSMTLVACYGSEERLIDCSYHEFTDSKDDSMDIGINCGSRESYVCIKTKEEKVYHKVSVYALLNVAIPKRIDCVCKACLYYNYYGIYNLLSF